MATGMNDCIIKTTDLSKIYTHDFIDVEHGRLRFNFFRRTVALDKLNLEVGEGEIFGLLGPNGAGKSTCIKILMGILFPNGGKASIMGKPLGEKDVKSQIGFLPENPSFYDYLKGEEFLNYYGMLYGMSRELRKKRIPELFELVRLPEHAPNLPLKGYSKGMIQRIGLAQALLNDPRLVVLDEPQSGLDPLGRKEIRDIILSLKERGKTVFFSSHILSDAELICDRVAILNRGKLTAMGELEKLLSRNVTDFEMVVTGLSRETLDKMRERATKFLERERDVLMIFKKQEDVNEVLARVVQEKAQLISLTPRRETLEEYFIREVKKSSPDDREAGREAANV